MKNFGVGFVFLQGNIVTMKYLKILALACLSVLAFSCKDDEQLRIAEAKRAQHVNDSILTVISRHWKFDVAPLTPKAAQRINGWNEWEQFNNELHQKPTSTLEAFRRKAKVLVTKANVLKNNIPPFFNKPQVRARLGVIITNIQMIYTYMSIETIPDKKIISLIDEITRELDDTQKQFDEIIRFSEIQKEEGEEQMLRALDTTRLADPESAARLANPEEPVSEEGRPFVYPNKPGSGRPAQQPAYIKKQLEKRNN